MILAEVQINPLAPALVGAASALFVAFVAAWLGYRRYLREQAHQQDRLLSALFGELANIYEHYSYAAHELPTDVSDPREVRIRLQWSKYGDLRSTKDVNQYGFLSAGDVRLLLQLGLRVRNNDLFVDLLLADVSAAKKGDLSSAKTRMRYGIDTSYQLIHRLAANRPHLQKILTIIEHDLPGVKERA